MHVALADLQCRDCSSSEKVRWKLKCVSSVKWHVTSCQNANESRSEGNTPFQSSADAYKCTTFLPWFKFLCKCTTNINAVVDLKKNENKKRRENNLVIQKYHSRSHKYMHMYNKMLAKSQLNWRKKSNKKKQDDWNDQKLRPFSVYFVLL